MFLLFSGLSPHIRGKGWLEVSCFPKSPQPVASSDLANNPSTAKRCVSIRSHLALPGF